MKFNLKIAALTAMITVFVACSSDDDDNSNNPEVDNINKVDAYLEFENVFEGEEFALKTDLNSKNNGVINVTALKYLISEITFYGANGTEDYVMDSNESFHIVDLSCKSTLKKYFTNLPDGNYDRVSFLYGVSEEVHEKGTEAQGNMLVEAKKYGLDWGWTLGYRFLTYEGTYDGDKEKIFRVHNGSHGSSNEENVSRVENSKKIVIDFSDKGMILVSDKTSPKVHLSIDVSKILSNTNEIKLADYDGRLIINPNSTLVSSNIESMFVLDHIHATDPNFEIPTDNECEGVSNPNDDGHGHDDKEDGHEHGDNEDGHDGEKEDGHGHGDNEGDHDGEKEEDHGKG
ncbi:MbnP family protein [Aquimarina agarivorans]|uniref:MbnP family protein n=1 Tax=Aquimarina agarivorans TaxID=980584 RepID=UPI000248EC1A|nr:MbnP family protein [Aquimarina agarivorans]